MDYTQFLNTFPATTRERESKIKQALDRGKLYISTIEKHNKKHFKIYFRDSDGVTKSTQKKICFENIAHILSQNDLSEKSDETREILENNKDEAKKVYEKMKDLLEKSLKYQKDKKKRKDLSEKLAEINTIIESLENLETV